MLVNNIYAFNANIINDRVTDDGWTVLEFDAPVTNIGDEAFLNCDSVTAVVLPDTVTRIGIGAFGWCYYLESINLPYGLVEIGAEAFTSTS